jgi:DMSO/TMAO reductase YedYZ molybdopterin-dependent catalytic subunit
MRYILLPLVLLASPALRPAAAQPAPAAVLTIRGDVASPLTLKAEDLAAMPRETVSVAEQDGTKVNYQASCCARS